MIYRPIDASWPGITWFTKKKLALISFKNNKFLIYVDFVLNLWITMITRTQSCSFLTFLFKIDKQILFEFWHVYSQFLILGQVIWPDLVFAKCKTNLFLLFLFFFSFSIGVVCTPPQNKKQKTHRNSCIPKLKASFFNYLHFTIYIYFLMIFYHVRPANCIVRCIDI